MKFDVDGNPIPAAPAEKVAEVEEEQEMSEVDKQVAEQVDAAMSGMAAAVVKDPETVEAVTQMAMDAVDKAMANAAPPAAPAMGMDNARPMLETPGADRPGIAAFASVNALVERKAEIQGLLAKKSARIEELRLTFNAEVAALESEKDALNAEAQALPAKVNEYLSRVEARVAVQRAIFGLDA